MELPSQHGSSSILSSAWSIGHGKHSTGCHGFTQGLTQRLPGCDGKQTVLGTKHMFWLCCSWLIPVGTQKGWRLFPGKTLLRNTCVHMPMPPILLHPTPTPQLLSQKSKLTILFKMDLKNYIKIITKCKSLSLCCRGVFKRVCDNWVRLEKYGINAARTPGTLAGPWHAVRPCKEVVQLLSNSGLH